MEQNALKNVKNFLNTNIYSFSETSGANAIKLLRKFFVVNYRSKKTLLFVGLKYCGNLLSYCSNLLSFQGKFSVINIPMVI